MFKGMPDNVCDTCFQELKDFVEVEEMGITNDVDPTPEYEPCQLCDEPLTGTGYYKITKVKCSETLLNEIKKQVLACDSDGCGQVWDSVDREWMFGDLNSDLITVLSDAVNGLSERGAYKKLLSRMDDHGALEEIIFPLISCKKCGAQLDGWYQDVMAKTYYRTIPQLPALPKEITSIQHASASHSEVIEYYRSDCSIALIHLTKPAELIYMSSNVEGESKRKSFSAQEVLYIILATKQLKAFQGKGLHAPAVCFTEKPLTALKDTLLGREATVRQDTKAISWAPYGVMFNKKYLRKFDVAPVLHLSSSDERTLPDELKHRVVPFSTASNWNHEREWRCGEDITFDPAEATVLVPRFEQIAPFQEALIKENIRVKGFLPLLDLFACM